MIVATSIVLQRAMTYRKTPTFINWFSGLLLLAVITETIYHVMMDEQTVHELSFVFLIIAVAAKTRSLIKLRVQQPKDKKMLQKAVIFGAGKSCAIPVSLVVLSSLTYVYRLLRLRIPPLATRLYFLHRTHGNQARVGYALGLST